ncbi:MAG: hypothetical protein KJO46_02300 [Gammaproteobacteria bacterium]|nr:hypothetical protein [Gammaproteobacteria bacterium]
MKSAQKFSLFWPAVCAMLLVACASNPVLLPKSAAVPDGVDISGRWQLRAAPGDRPGDLLSPEPGILIPPVNSRRDPTRQPTRRSRGGAVHVFLERGQQLKISQTSAGLFISFDRAIVEEYTFGENRVVSVGPIKARRVSGWEDGSFVVQTLDQDGSVLTESWRLVEGGDVLLRSIAVIRGKKQQLAVEERFERL